MRPENPVVLLACAHCGELCHDLFILNDKPFCCVGCKTVYDILNTNSLCAYYQIDQLAGRQPKAHSNHTFEYLDSLTLKKQILSFDSPEFAKVVFRIPSIHCASCIWLIENISRINSGIIKSEVSFGKKTASFDFNPGKVKLSEIASLLADLGYGPEIITGEQRPAQRATETQLIYKLAVAGFCFGNIMLFSFPEYLGIGEEDHQLKSIFTGLNLALAVPVIFYSAAGYFSLALKSFRQKQINVDVPIAAGLLALFTRSAYDILSGTGPGYLDSLSGLVFFLLIGRWFQNKTYESLAFDRDYKSYFPLAIHSWINGQWSPVLIYGLVKGNVIRLRNMEIVPADAIMNDEHAFFDYSFITGEAKPIKAVKNMLIYAGARLIGQPVTMTIEKATSQSHLTSLWNKIDFKKKEESNFFF